MTVEAWLALIGLIGGAAAWSWRIVITSRVRRRPLPALQVAGARAFEVASSDFGGVSKHSTVTPMQLPPDVPRFTGRAQEQHRILKLLGKAGRSDTARGVVVYGPGGIGKTTLAVHIAHRLRSRFPDGQLYVDLRGIETEPLSSEDVLFGFLRDLGLDGNAIPAGSEGRSRMFRSRLAGRRVLVVLDNAAGEPQVRPLLPGTGSSRVIITSRNALHGLDVGERINLEVMSDEAALELLESLVGVHRMTAERDGARNLLRLCGNLPLAVRIAGARIAARPDGTIGNFVARLSDARTRLDEFRVGDLEVRSNLMLSYRTRNQDERGALLAAATLPAQPFCAWQLAFATGVPEVQLDHTAEALLEGQMLLAAGEVGGRPAYRLHDLTRLYLREQTHDREETDFDLTADRYLSALLGVCHVAARGVGFDYPLAKPERRGAQASDSAALYRVALLAPMEFFDHHWQAIVAAVDLAVEASMWNQGWRLANALTGYFWLRAERAAWERIQHQGLVCAQASRSLVAEAYLRASAAELHRLQRRWDAARSEAGQALETFRSNGYGLEVAQCTHEAGLIAEKLRDFPESIRLYRAALVDFRRLGYRLGEAYTLNSIGFTYRWRGEWDSAHRYFSEALVVAEEVGDLESESGARRGLADVALGRQDWVDAIHWYEGCLSTMRKLGNTRSQVYARAKIAEVRRYQGKLAESMAELLDCLATFRVLGEKIGEAHALHNIGEIHMARRRWRDAREAFQGSLDLFRELTYDVRASQVKERLRQLDLK